MKRVIPNSITLLGMMAALMSMILAPSHAYWACIALIIASLCDMIDGRVARLLDAQSEFGQQLDSLVDVVAFGVAPAFLAYHWGLATLPTVIGIPLGLIPAFAFMAATAVRLAKFNLGGQPEGMFVGVPSPVAALLVTTVVMAAHEMGWMFLRQPQVVGGALIVAAALMVAPMTFPTYKRFETSWGKALFYGAIIGGLTMLVFSEPGGTVLLVILSWYVLRGVLRVGVTSRSSV
ncbi:MAG: CDP-alcohol phosphatidyltransferase family protein [Myxococcota bacterium]